MIGEVQVSREDILRTLALEEDLALAQVKIEEQAATIKRQKLLLEAVAHIAEKYLGVLSIEPNIAILKVLERWPW